MRDVPRAARSWRTIRWLSPPPGRDPEESLRARVAHWLAIAAITTVVPLTVLVPLTETAPNIPYVLPLYLSTLIASMAIFVVLHLGWIKTAGVLFSLLGWLVTAWASFAIGGIASPQLSMAVLSIMLTGFLWSGPAAIGMAALTSISLLGFEMARDAGMLPAPHIVATRFTTWLALSSVLALAAVFLQIFVRTLHAARNDAAQQSRRLEEEMKRRVETEASLQRAQKLEALGRLTGGIAHDFNNILTVLLGESEMLEDHAATGRPLTDEELEQITDIRISAERASALTRQLLAFSRRQSGIPEIIDPDRTLERLQPMLTRLIREDVTLRAVCGAGGAQIRIDAGQLEQVLMNLVLNARDAMPWGGEITLETSSAHLDDRHAVQDPNAHPGEYVVISVADTGVGIHPADLERIFDPFFTTKGVGHGTGLGLASAHGIITQAGGFITVESEPERGTVFRLRLPAVASTGASREETVPVEPVPRTPSRGTILVCEDDVAVRRVIQRALVGAGYQVFEADAAEGALAWLRGHDQPVELLVSDVIMPGMNGLQLARLAAHERPGLRVMLVSGYTSNVLVDSGVPPEVELLQKPFTPDALLDRVGMLLEGRGRAGGTH